LQAIRVNQIEVADQIGRRNVVPGDGDRPVERPADPVQLEAAAVAFEQLGDD
jgi:hypothetical protein